MLSVFIFFCFAGSNLKEASLQQQFFRNVTDIEGWLSDVEGQLMSEDFGKVIIRILT